MTLQAHEGPVYVDVSCIDAIGPSLMDLRVAMRALYLRGGQLVAILDTPENMAAIFETKGSVQ